MTPQQVIDTAWQIAKQMVEAKQAKEAESALVDPDETTRHVAHERSLAEQEALNFGADVLKMAVGAEWRHVVQMAAFAYAQNMEEGR